jgi:putative PIN family toxin of toxin-antitoxin system
MRIVADTAILVRTNAKAFGPARELLDTMQRCGAVLVVSPFLIEEVQRVLLYPRIRAIYRLEDAELQQHVDYLQTFAEIVTPAEGPPIVLEDPDDDPVVYTAVAGAADVICTVDRHFYAPNVLAFCSRRGIQVMDDVTLLRTLRESTA